MLISETKTISSLDMGEDEDYFVIKPSDINGKTSIGKNNDYHLNPIMFPLFKLTDNPLDQPAFFTLPNEINNEMTYNLQGNYYAPPPEEEPGYSPFDYEYPYLDELDLSLEDAEFFQNISHRFNLTDDMKDKLRINGLIVVNHTRINGYSSPFTSFLDAYESYWQKDLPIFITTDTILHTFHLLFDTMLKDIENQSLCWRIESMSKFLYGDSMDLYDSLEEGILKDISRETAIFFCVAAKLMDSSIVIPSPILDNVTYYVEKIMDAKEVVLEYTYDGKQFYVDYSQYKPRGHYAGDELLEKYFRCMMWFGRKSLDMNLTNDVREALLIAQLMDDNTQAEQLWYEVYNITRFLVGASDSLSFLDIKKAAMRSVGELSVEMLESDDNLELIREELKKPDYLSQRILSTIVMKSPSQANEKMDFPKIFQFMGQRYVPDSEVIQNVIYDRVPLYKMRRRGLANGLDVMTSLGSYRALDHLEAELAHFNYTEYLEYSYDLMDSMTDEFWKETTYNGWLDSYSSLVADTKTSPQPFMRTRAWADEKLNSVLGSWAELRHDTILYAKQPYSVGVGCSTPDAWAEPYPTFYTKMAELSNRTISILNENIPESEVAERFSSVFSEFETINNNLSAISQKELDDEELTLDEKIFLKNIFSRVINGCGFKIIYGWLPELLEAADVDDDKMDTRIIADVNTDPGSDIPPMPPRVLHVGVGYVETIIVLLKKPDGNYTFAVGPVYSYYEFPEEGFTRLNDDQWKDKLDTGEHKRPFWAKSFLVNDNDCMINEYE
jgi:hypothetical protein